jgi:hypothetical protein
LFQQNDGGDAGRESWEGKKKGTEAKIQREDIKSTQKGLLLPNNQILCHTTTSTEILSVLAW